MTNIRSEKKTGRPNFNGQKEHQVKKSFYNVHIEQITEEKEKGN